MQIPGFSDFLMLTTGIIHSDSPKHPVWWPQSRVLTVRCQNLFGLDQTQVGWICTENCQFFWGGKTTPWNCRCCDLIQPTPVMKMFAKSRWRRCPMVTRSQTWHDQKHVTVVRCDGCLYNHPYFERKLGKCSNRFEGCAPFLCFSCWWIAHLRNLRCWSASTKFIKLFKSKWRLNQFAFKLGSIDIFQRISTSFCLLDGRISQSLKCIGANTNKPTISFLWDLTCIRESLPKIV